MGRRGEDAVARWYEARGYAVVARNWRCRSGELDLVVRGPDVLVFCEVKTRSSAAFGSPLEAVTVTKARRLRRLAGEWLVATGEHAPDLRVDVAAVGWRPDGRHDIEVVEGIG
jgi:putative endonuclease